jgi:hypothetical protein
MSPFLIMSSKIDVLDVIFFGMLLLPMAAQVGSCWGSILVCLVLVLSLMGDFYVKFTLRYKSTDFKFVLYSIYGPAQSQNKGGFLAELANTCSKENLPFIVRGDFNIMRKPKDKRCGDFDTK